MRVRFQDKDLDRLETDPDFDGGYPAEAVSGFRKRMQQIRSAPDERTFYQIKSLHFEKLPGRGKDRSMRLNKQWRLIVQLEDGESEKTLVVVGIEDYH